MTTGVRPGEARLFAPFLLVAGLLTGYFGLSANGYLVPAFTVQAMAALLWLGKLGGLFKWVTLINVVSGLVLVLVLWLGDFLGDRKLDVSGVSLLVNLLTGGPGLGLIAPGLLLGLRRGKPLNAWFNPASAAA